MCHITIINITCSQTYFHVWRSKGWWRRVTNVDAAKQAFVSVAPLDISKESWLVAKKGCFEGGLLTSTCV